MTWENVIEFLSIYWRDLVSAIVLIISVIICLVKKRPCVNQMDEIKEDVLEMLPLLISSVEKPGFGSQKKESVIQLISNYVDKKYHICVSPQLLSFIDNAIENILSTPNKKGE